MGIVLGDGHALFGDLLRQVLEDQGFPVVALAGDPDELICDLVRHRPRIVVVHLRSLTTDSRPDEPGAVRALLTRVVVSAPPPARVVVLDAETPPTLAEVGGPDQVAFLDASGGIDELLRALRHMREGRTFTRRSTDRPPMRATTLTASARLAASLTMRERECLSLLVDGAPTERIVRDLGISVMTVRSHIQSIFYKLGVHSRVEAAALAVRHGLLTQHEVVGQRTG